MLNRNFGYALTVLGLLVLCIGVLQAYYVLPIPKFATLTVDSSPPDIWLTFPDDGKTYWGKIDYASAYVRDMESPVDFVSIIINEVEHPMMLEEGTVNDGVWRVHFDEPLSAGTYRFRFVAINRAGLSSFKDGTFIIPEKVPLEGEWYVNDQKVASKDQTVYVASNNVTFKFVKTSGSPDSMIFVSVIVWINGEHHQKVMDHVAEGTWTSTWMLEDGTYKVELIAQDPTTNTEVTMSIVNLKVGQQNPIPPALLNIYTISGSIMTAIGLLIASKED